MTKDLYHAFEKVHMLISCCYTMLLPQQMILFCTPMAKSVPLYNEREKEEVLL